MPTEWANVPMFVRSIFEDGIREQMKIPEDWVYIRSPMKSAAWQRLIDVVGVANINIVSGQSWDGITSYSVFFSPEGVQLIKDNVAKIMGEENN